MLSLVRNSISPEAEILEISINLLLFRKKLSTFAPAQEDNK